MATLRVIANTAANNTAAIAAQQVPMFCSTISWLSQVSQNLRGREREVSLVSGCRAVDHFMRRAGLDGAAIVGEGDEGAGKDMAEERE